MCSNFLAHKKEREKVSHVNLDPWRFTCNKEMFQEARVLGIRMKLNANSTAGDCVGFIVKLTGMVHKLQKRWQKWCTNVQRQLCFDVM